MKAVFFRKPGGLDVLEYGDVPTPEPREGEALIRVKACGLNHLDIWIRTGQQNITSPRIVGSDVSGVIEALRGKSNLRVGDEVVANPERACGTCHRCTRGRACEMVSLLGRQGNGGYAEYVAIPLEQVYPKPKNLSFTEAAAFPLTFLTAWHALMTRAMVENGETVFVWGATGSVGPAAVQVSKMAGANVIAAVYSKEAGDAALSWGADEVVVYTDENVLEKVRALTQSRGVDIVFESVGEKTFAQSLAMLAPYGRIVTIGATSGENVSFNLSEFYPKQLSIIGSRMGTKEEFEKVLALMEEGKLKPVVDSVFPLREAAEAQRRMEEGKHVGKIVLEV